MVPTPILEMARAYGLRPQLWLLVQADLASEKINGKLKHYIPYSIFKWYKETKHKKNEWKMTSIMVSKALIQSVPVSSLFLERSSSYRSWKLFVFVCRITLRIDVDISSFEIQTM